MHRDITHSRLIERVEDEHEAIDVLLDRLRPSRPRVDEPVFRELEKLLTSRLGVLCGELYRSTGPARRWRLRLLLERPREWASLLHRLNREPLGSDRWWLKLDDLRQRVRQHFDEVENELLGVVCDDGDDETEPS